jgi:trans-2,3-dihydro-3-hydroxyanthranilate isomerase
MPSWSFHQLDVFTTTPLAGNALAVFPDARGLAAPTMQALAREMNLSETTFVFPSDAATRHVRFFTPTAEIPLAGHPTIGTWWALAELDQVPGLPTDGTGTVTQETGQGVLPVAITRAGGKPVRVVMTQARPTFRTTVPDISALARAVGDGGALVTEPAPQVVSTALPQLMAGVRSVERLAALPSGGGGGDLARLLRTLDTDCVMLWAPPVGGRVRCRMFAPGFNIPEDPATGSAAGALGAYLVRHGVVRPVDGVVALTVEQGGEIGRPSLIDVRVTVGDDGAIDGVTVGGQAVQVITGTVTL